MDKMQEYYKNAILANLCNEYKSDWRDAMQSKEALFNLAMVQQSIPHLMTFAYNGIGLTKEYLKNEFSDYINGKYTAINADGVDGNYKTSLYVGENAIFRPSDDVSAFMWATIPNVIFKTSKAAKIYVGCESNINIIMQGYNSITIMLFDESKVTIDECDTTCDVNVYKYSNMAKVETHKYCLANVKIHEKTLKI